MNPAVAVLATFSAAVSLTAGIARAETGGEQIFSRKCTMCHVVKGKGGAIGPELTKVSSRMSIEEIRSQIENPKKKTAATAMPSFRTLSRAEMTALLEYIRTLK